LERNPETLSPTGVPVRVREVPMVGQGLARAAPRDAGNVAAREEVSALEVGERVNMFLKH